MIERFQAVVAFDDGTVRSYPEFLSYTDCYNDLRNMYFWYWSKYTEYVAFIHPVSIQIVKLIYQEPEKRIMANIDFEEIDKW